MEKNLDFKHLYTDDYFDARRGNDPLRIKSFKLESEFIYKYTCTNINSKLQGALLSRFANY